MVKAEGSAQQCTVIGQSLRASPQLAALANGVANHAMDYDFTFLNGQSVAAVIPALLPLAEIDQARRPPTCSAPSSSAARSPPASTASSLRMGNDGGWHITGIVGVIATTAACAKLMKLPVEQVANAIGIARFAVGGHRGQLRHHDQAAALRQRRAQRRDGGDAGEQGLHLARRGVRRQQRLLLRASAARCRPISRRSTISASAGTWSRSASRPSTIRAAGAATPRSKRR